MKLTSINRDIYISFVLSFQMCFENSVILLYIRLVYLFKYEFLLKTI